MKKIPKSELLVMNFIWDKGIDKIPAREVANYMENSHGWAKGTTGKVLSRLSDKGFLEFEKDGRNTLYTIKVKHEEYLKFETKDFLELIHKNSIHSFISSLGCENEISDDDIKELEQWLKKRK
ncbi:BlaI/MecI/CopY family transcriptional regulator [Clostridioides difficile]|nr:BlaI/MecI/CopY family transcriptional regulator [Clostridioides difficile]MDO0372474.1 BlaI/MecI/CopY family transcriptional regulator [Clostridioides difficile]NJA31890.1 BlaI/MecI/CopY family transcriptional regulator [Clostridioides difficile]NKN21717.1 BlaI/MecI/CopY family transcriptional regulator [Clostridioides difficile]HBG2772791.1 BlaI/MecI/CopY family transcriptional regulator [Clostridioides difficile]HBG7378549.1 BlaI/MecI/CopY family transcriptional regulator [Clostridioides 